MAVLNTHVCIGHEWPSKLMGPWLCLLHRHRHQQSCTWPLFAEATVCCPVFVALVLMYAWQQARCSWRAGMCRHDLYL